MINRTKYFYGTRKHSGFVHFIFVLLLGLVVFAGIGFFAYKNGGNKTHITNKSNSTPIPVPSPLFINGENNSNKFVSEDVEFDYPSDWVSVGDDYFKSGDRSSTLGVLSKEYYEEYGCFYTKFSERKIINGNEITIQHKEGISSIDCAEEGNKSLVAKISNNGKTYFLELRHDSTLNNQKDDQVLNQILSTFKFLTNKEEALQKVRNLKEVQDYLKRVPKGHVDTQKEPQNGKWTIHVYEVNESNLTATFNWYHVNRFTGEITKEFNY